MASQWQRSAWLAGWSALWAVLLAACANVGFDHGKTRLDEKSLVFGRIILDRDGEMRTISPFSMPVVIRDIETAAEPKMLAQDFEKDGRFHWTLPPGNHQLNIILHHYSGGVQSFGFHVEKPGAAYYFGDLTLHGSRRFDTLGGANMRDTRPEFQDRFPQASRELLERNPELGSIAVERLALRDMTRPAERAALYGQALQAKAPCCASLSALPYEALKPGDGITRKIDADSPVFDFPQGRSRFVAWKLPTSPDIGYTLALRSVATPSNLPGTGQFYVFSPAVMVLDGDFNVLGTQEQGIFFPVPASMVPPRSASLQGRIESARLPAGAKYLVLYTTKSIIEGVWTTSAPGFIPIAGGVLPSGRPVSVRLEPAISGVIEAAVEIAPGPSQSAQP